MVIGFTYLRSEGLEDDRKLEEQVHKLSKA